MEFKKFANTYVLRLDKGEEIVETLKKFCKEEGISLGWVKGIGAANRAVIGLLNTKDKKYTTRELLGDHEIVSLVGNISNMDGEVYLHLHIALANEDYITYGGHLDSAIIGATGEIIIETIDGDVGRSFSQEIGLNLMDFD